jgi:asparagine synthase (glutamine-hydrolysing)
VYELAKQQGVKVVLDGQGADEVLAGYSKYYQWYLQELYAGNRRQFRKESASLPLQEFGFKNKLAATFPSWAAVQLERKSASNQKRLPFISKDFLNEYFTTAPIYKPRVKTLNDILYFDVFGGNLEELLRNADRNAMAHGIEVRLPFLNHHLVQFIFSLPASFKIHDGYSKYILRQAMDGMLPKEVTWRKDKVGFEPPQQQWMQDTRLQEKIREAKKKLVKEKILAPAVLDNPVKPTAAYDAGNYDWRFLCAAQLP